MAGKIAKYAIDIILIYAMINGIRLLILADGDVKQAYDTFIVFDQIVIMTGFILAILSFIGINHIFFKE